jgi:hypothetical protein
MNIEKKTREHMFELELDIVKFNENSDRIRLIGYLGERVDVQYDGKLLKMIGSEGFFKLHINEEEVNGFKKG